MLVYKYKASCSNCGNNYYVKLVQGYIPEDIKDNVIQNIEGKNICNICLKPFELQKDEFVSDESEETTSYSFSSPTYLRADFNLRLHNG